jgi:hypothetical protein
MAHIREAMQIYRILVLHHKALLHHVPIRYYKHTIERVHELAS